MNAKGRYIPYFYKWNKIFELMWSHSFMVFELIINLCIETCPNFVSFKVV